MQHLFRPLLAGVFALVAIALPATYGAASEPGSEPPGFHGMLLFGSERIYVSHLPMFMPQHRYQGIWEVSFGEAADAAYRAERARPENAGVIFTVAPNELFRLPELTGGRDSFEADLFVGHFERPGRRLLLEGVTVTLQRPVHWHPFFAGDERPDHLTYALFGDVGGWYLAHWISAAPDYDQILKVVLAALMDRVPEGAQFVMLDRTDDQPLMAGDVADGLMIHRARANGPVEVERVSLTVRAQHYFEANELSFDELAGSPTQ